MHANSHACKLTIVLCPSLQLLMDNNPLKITPHSVIKGYECISSACIHTDQPNYNVCATFGPHFCETQPCAGRLPDCRPSSAQQLFDVGNEYNIIPFNSFICLVCSCCFAILISPCCVVAVPMQSRFDSSLRKTIASGVHDWKLALCPPPSRASRMHPLLPHPVFFHMKRPQKPTLPLIHQPHNLCAALRQSHSRPRHLSLPFRAHRLRLFPHLPLRRGW